MQPEGKPDQTSIAQSGADPSLRNSEMHGVVYLLGAGASREAGVPVASELMQRIVQQFNEADPRDVRRTDLAQTLNFVLGAMIHHATQQGARPDVLPNIEAVASAVELLWSRSTLEATPFVRGWIPGVASTKLEKTRGGLATRRLMRALNSRSGEHEVEKAIREIARSEIGILTEVDRFQPLLLELIRAVVENVTVPDPTATGYLSPLVGTARDRQTTIATLNYDTTIEMAADRAGVPCSTGITSWNDEWRLEWPPTGIRLLKLHGSVDWAREEAPGSGSSGVLRPVTQDVGVVLDPAEDLPFIVFGQREKLRPEGPFLDLRSEFANSLRRSDHLVVVGYSFGDEHVNELIRRWLRSNLKAILTVVDPGFPTNWAHTTNPFIFDLTSNLRRQDGAEMNRILEARLSVIRESASKALPKVTAGPEALEAILNDQLASPARSDRLARSAE